MRTAILGLLVTMAAWAATPDPVHWSAAAGSGKPGHPGATVTAKLRAAIDSGWHLYAMQQDEGGPAALDIALTEGSGFALGSVRASKPVQVFDPNFEKRVQLYVDHAEFNLPLTISTDMGPGEQKAPIHVRYQCCNDTMCLPPRTVTVEVPFFIK